MSTQPIVGIAIWFARRLDELVDKSAIENVSGEKVDTLGVTVCEWEYRWRNKWLV